MNNKNWRQMVPFVMEITAIILVSLIVSYLLDARHNAYLRHGIAGSTCILIARCFLRKRVRQTKWLANLDDATIESLAMEAGARPPVSCGVIVNYVPGASPASTAGLNRWDIITTVGGKPIRDVADFLSRMDELAAGHPGVLTVVRRDLNRTDGTNPWKQVSLHLMPDGAVASPSPLKPCPLEFISAKRILDNPSADALVIGLKNIAGQPVAGLSLCLVCYGSDEQQTSSPILSQGLDFSWPAHIEPGDTYCTTLDLTDARKALPQITRVRAAIARVEMMGGSCWQAQPGQVVCREIRHWGQPAATTSHTNPTAQAATPAAVSGATPASQAIPATEEEIRFSCPACGQHLKMATRYVGRNVKCRKCQAVVTVPIPRDPSPAGPMSVAPPSASAAPSLAAAARSQPDWYFTAKGQTVGPVTLADLQQRALAGQMGQADLVWRQGTNQWIEVGKALGSLEGGPAMDYASLPWYRRSGVMSIILIGGVIGPFIGVFLLPPVLPPLIAICGLGLTCVVLVMGDIHYNQRLADGSLRKWHWMNKVVAGLVLLGWLFSTIQGMFFSP